MELCSESTNQWQEVISDPVIYHETKHKSFVKCFCESNSMIEEESLWPELIVVAGVLFLSGEFPLRMVFYLGNPIKN